MKYQIAKLAREWNVSTKALLTALNQAGVNVANHLAWVSEHEASEARRFLNPDDQVHRIGGHRQMHGVPDRGGKHQVVRLAGQWNIPSNVLLRVLGHVGVRVGNHLAWIDEADAAAARRFIEAGGLEHESFAEWVQIIDFARENCVAPRRLLGALERLGFTDCSEMALIRIDDARRALESVVADRTLSLPGCENPTRAPNQGNHGSRSVTRKKRTHHGCSFVTPDSIKFSLSSEMNAPLPKRCVGDELRHQDALNRHLSEEEAILRRREEEEEEEAMQRRRRQQEEEEEEEEEEQRRRRQQEEEEEEAMQRRRRQQEEEEEEEEDRRRQEEDERREQEHRQWMGWDD
jgi:hypothetical protein